MLALCFALALAAPTFDEYARDVVDADEDAPTTTPSTTPTTTPEPALAPLTPEPAEARWFGFAQDVSRQGLGLFAVSADDVVLSPFITVVGGAGFEHIERGDSDDDQRQDRATTLAFGRVGVFGQVGRFFSLESEVEMNAGPHGTSVWEGQAALQVRNQLLRVELPELVFADRLRLEVGRVTDETSLNYFSRHTADQLLSDEVARLPVLLAGFNRGNGVNLRYTLFDVVTLGVTANAGNPTATTGTLMMGGTFPPFARFYEVPQSSVGRDARRFPVDSFNVMLLSPSIAVDSKWVRAHASTQLVSADTNMNSTKDAPLEGFNVRAGVDVTAFDDLFSEEVGGWDNGLRFFLNGSRIENDVVKAQDLSKLRVDRYEAYTGSGGFDLDLYGKSGVGVDVAAVRELEPGRPPLVTLFANVGATLWLNDLVSLSARGALQQQCLDFDCTVDGVRSVFVTGRVLLGPPAPARP